MTSAEASLRIACMTVKSLDKSHFHRAAAYTTENVGYPALFAQIPYPVRWGGGKLLGIGLFWILTCNS